MTVDEAVSPSCSSWSKEQDKAFENALATHFEVSPDWWEKVASDVPGKTLEEIKLHYEDLVEDVNRIEAGRVPLPSYSSACSDGSASNLGEEESGKKGSGGSGESNQGGKGSRSDQERRKGIAWTEEEHRLFLLGLDKYGKGDWRSISRNFVVTRTPTQVASHAQKYFIRLSSVNKDRRRSSIHDITTVGSGDLSAPQGPITGQNQTDGSAGGVSSGKSNKQSPQSPAVTSGVAVSGPPPSIGQPVGGPFVSAVGTPVNLSTAPHMAYGVRGQVQGTVVPGAPINMGSVTYPMPHASAHR
ncbi:hypothetical protein ACJRO7_003318 [Eucalyptus globulus]|uniref:Uncharacterized protein n=1 Tax=Eucalyptus globulus TaxID=34317 RepID=A0ABD3IXE6_EUCGL